MAKEETQLLEKVQDHVQQLLVEELPAAYVYHNYDHAVEVVEVCEELADAAGLKAEEKEVLLLAAWFHDTGFIKDPENHEAISQEYASEFLRKEEVDKEVIAKVTDLIESTKDTHEPETLLEKILHDANYSFLGRKRFERRGRLLRLEKEHIEEKKYDLYEWSQHLLNLQLKTKYYTSWAVEAYSKRKNKNIASQRESLIDARKIATRKKTGKDFGRGVDTIYRVTLRNHINLSSIADGKANMIISINTLVLSILITATSAGFGFSEDYFIQNRRFIFPVLLLMLTSLLAITFAVFSAIPKVSGQEFTEEDVKSHKVSLLYFGNFLKIPKEEFVGYLRDLKHDQEVLYDDLSRDLYNLGAVLSKKYRLLTISYRLFVGGLGLSFLVFIIGFLLL
jgi:HD superfamily phosphodiesterase